MAKTLVAAVISLANSSWNADYYPPRLNEARTVFLKTPGKDSYEDPGAWWPIIFLSTFSKAIETIVAKRVQALIEQRRLLLDSQMGERQGQSVDTALEFLTEHIQQFGLQGRR
jgi:hypothetical protein